MPRAEKGAIAGAGAALAAVLREAGIGHALRGLAGPARVVVEPPALEFLAATLPERGRTLVELLCLGLPVPLGRARGALGDEVLTQLEALEVVVVRDGAAHLPTLALFATPFGWLIGDRPLGFPGVTPRPARAFLDDESMAVAEHVARAAPVASAADIGCGAGLTTLAAARSAARVVAVDVQPEAVRAARLTVALCRLGDRVEVVEGDLLPGRERYDRLVAVLPALPLPACAPAPAHAGGEGGSALSARLIREAPSRLVEGGEVWLGAAVLLAGDWLLRTPLLEALEASGASVAWSRGAAVAVPLAAEALGRMLGCDQPEASARWEAAVHASLSATGATALAPAVFRASWAAPRDFTRETVADRGDLVQWLR